MTISYSQTFLFIRDRTWNHHPIMVLMNTGKMKNRIVRSDFPMKDVQSEMASGKWSVIILHGQYTYRRFDRRG